MSIAISDHTLVHVALCGTVVGLFLPVLFRSDFSDLHLAKYDAWSFWSVILPYESLTLLAAFSVHTNSCYLLDIEHPWGSIFRQSMRK